LLIDDDQIVTNVVPHPPVGHSNHAVIEFLISVLPDRKLSSGPSTQTRKYQWYRADYDSMQEYLLNIDWFAMISTHPSALSAWTAFVHTIQKTVDLFVPSHLVSGNPNRSLLLGKPRRPHDLRKLETKQRHLWKMLQLTPYDPLLRSKYRECIFKYRQLLQQHEARIEEHIITSDNLGMFYPFVNKRVANRSGIVFDSSGVALTDDVDKANTFNRYFSSVGVTDNNTTPRCESVTLSSKLDTIVIDKLDVMHVINKLKCKTSCGPDGLPPILFKRLGTASVNH